ncbi:MAG: hypothetical protein LBC55_08175 [Desulfovibrio sp.]|jgi:peptidoglycan/xylan/chitin deacetylase (PgdA/CDA1 family)|nr:hypothetical protein [Desulfovibrio sp.]
MRVLNVFAAEADRASMLLTAALRRSFTSGPVRGPLPADSGVKGMFSVFADCGNCPPEAVRAAVRGGGKIMLTGTPGPDIMSVAGLKKAPDLRLPPEAAQAEHCFFEPFHESAARITYTGHPPALTSPVRDRAFCRYDYAEWNNLGFGAVRVGGDFGVTGGVEADGADVLARMTMTAARGVVELGPYMTLLDTPTASVLWCARPVGPLDGTEWQVVERFFSDRRTGELPCLPYLLQTPRGTDCIVTMCMDCDEAVASCRDLFELYVQENIPFSVAVKTGQDLNGRDMALLRAIRASGGSILSHSHDHARNWGSDHGAVKRDVRRSTAWFQRNLPEMPPPKLAVSPFHSNPVYAVQALEEAGIKGFVGGIIDYDPEFLLGRAGRAPFARKILTVSRQSMLHGDSYRNQGQSVAVHVRAFAAQHQARGIFGYLDHPFSERYQYGWKSAEQRATAHRQLLTAIRERGGVMFLSQEQCFAFVGALATAQLHMTDAGRVRAVCAPRTEFVLQYRLEGEERDLPGGV